MTGEYNLFAKGYIDLATDSPEEDVSIRFERAGTGETYDWLTRFHRKTYTAREVATVMFERLEQAQDPDDQSPKMRTVYTDKYTVDVLEKIVSKSLSRRDTTVATEAIDRAPPPHPLCGPTPHRPPKQQPTARRPTERPPPTNTPTPGDPHRPPETDPRSPPPLQHPPPPPGPKPHQPAPTPGPIW